jgi:hypothetical protein
MWTYAFEWMFSGVLNVIRFFEKLAATHPITQNHIPDNLSLVRFSDDGTAITSIIVIVSECSQRWININTLD